MTALTEARCQPCGGVTRPMSSEEARRLAAEVPDWTVRQARQLEREFSFDDFDQAMRFVNQLADLAREQGHHPDFCVSYRTVRVTLSTHKIGGLSRNDFILAAKIGHLLRAK